MYVKGYYNDFTLGILHPIKSSKIFFSKKKDFKSVKKMVRSKWLIFFENFFLFQ